MDTSFGSDGMTLPKGEGKSITGKILRGEIRNETSKKKKRRQGKKEAQEVPCTDLITWTK
jgi:hypothetical protein